MKLKMSVWVGELKPTEGVERPVKEQIITIRIAVINHQIDSLKSNKNQVYLSNVYYSPYDTAIHLSPEKSN